MSNHHSKKWFITFHQQKNNALKRRIERQQLWRQVFEQRCHDIRLEVEYWMLARVGFIFSWLTAAAVIVIASLKDFR